MDATLTTAEVAERAGVNIHTVRYYESRGLLPIPPRTAAGYRLYDMHHVKHLRFVRRAQELGFSLREIQELLELRVTPTGGSDVKDRIQEKINEIDARIRDMQKIRDKLKELKDECEQHGSPHSCLVLHALDAPDEEQEQ